MNHSSQQLQIRILTGMHAGAALFLSQGSYEIGTDLECDVVISDWPFEHTGFTISEDEPDEFSITFDDEQLAAPFGVNEPQQIGDVVIVACKVGDEANRPSDLQLLTQMLAPVITVPARRQRIGGWVIGGVCAVVITVSAFTLQSSRSVAATKVKNQNESPAVQVREALQNLKYPGLRVTVEGENVIVAGLVKNLTDRKNLAMQLQSLKTEKIVHRYAVESEIAAAISDAIAYPGITVAHTGGGKFEIRGEVPQKVRDRVNLNRLKTDLGAVVSEISFRDVKVAAVRPVEPEILQSVEGYEFRRAADGARYFNEKQ
ncbi:MAG: hypothetical protein V4695_06725 [Pseudomonadota bacterium]